MEKIYRFFALGLVVAFTANFALQAQPPQFTWAKHAYGYGLMATSIGADGAGNCYTVGLLESGGTFDNYSFYGASAVGHEFYIAKYSAAGNVEWAFAPAINQFAIEAQNIAVDAMGNSYITGHFRGATTLGSIVPSPNNSVVLSTNNSMFGGPVHMFVAKYDAAGNLLWAEKAGAPGLTPGTNDCVGVDIALDANGDCSIVGNFKGTVTFGSTTLTSEGGTNLFIAKYDAAGTLKWAKKTAGGNFGDVYSFNRGIGVDPAGNILITGSFSNNANFGANSLISSGVSDIFIAKYDKAGNSIWARRAGGSGADSGQDVALDAAGNSYLTGSFSASATFGTNTLVSNGNADFFIAKYDPLGNVLWVRKAGGTESDFGYDLALDAGGNCYVTGSFRGSATFGSAVIPANGAVNLFAAKYNSGGDLLWIKQVDGNYTTLGTQSAIALDPAGNSFLTSTFGGNPTFENTTLSSALNAGWSQNIYVAKLTDPALVQPLPVTLLYLKGISKENANLLTWATATEKNSSYFVVERSADGKSFEAIGKVKASGNSSQQMHYTFSDKNATVSGAKTIYYRLKQVDLDGSFEYSPVISIIRKSRQSAVLIYPNPFREDLWVELPAEGLNGTAKVQLNSLAGQTIFQQELHLDGANHTHKVTEVAKLPAGIYLLIIQAGEAVTVYKVSKQ